MKHFFNFSFRVIMALFLGMAVLTATGSTPFALAFTVSLFAIGYVPVVAQWLGLVKSGRQIRGLALLPTQFDIFNPTQLQAKDIALNAIYLHYGYRFNATTGKYEKGEAGRELPDFLDNLRIQRRDYMQSRYLTPLTDSFDFFATAQDPNRPTESNLNYVVMPNNQLAIMFGIIGELAIGAAATDTPAILNYNVAPPVGEEEVINSYITLTVNKLPETDTTPYKSLFINDDAVRGFFRFPRPIVWEPASGIKLNIKLAAAYAAATHRFQRFTIPSWELTK